MNQASAAWGSLLARWIEATIVWLLRALYDVAWLVVMAGWGAKLAWERKAGWIEELTHRLGYLPSPPADASRVIWIHAVSVGEYRSVMPIVRRVKRADPNAWVMVTMSNRPTFEMARSSAPLADSVAFVPWDSRWIVRRALRRVRPAILAIVECEIWPSLILEASCSSTRVIMINARIYERDFSRYLFARRLFAPILAAVDAVYALSPKEAERFALLGVDASRLCVEGNTKYDVDISSPNKHDWLALPDSCRVLILASTHPDEERQILRASGELIQEFGSLRWIMAPRDPSRGKEIEAMARTLGMSAICRSAITDPQDSQVDVIVMDTLGELASLFRLADVVFVGGSLVDVGGHNPIEAAAWGKPVIMGSSCFNFEDIVTTLLREEAIRLVDSAEDLARAIRIDLQNPELARRRGVLGKRVVAEHQGSSARYGDRLLGKLPRARAG
jgi:3-deoxy-D-manno-octulosonic-acid transferase